MENIYELIKQKEKELKELKKKADEQVVKLSSEDFIKALNGILYSNFETDGCNCGTIEFDLNENYSLEFHRSCRKSSGCTNNYWELHKPRLYVNRNYKDDEFLEYVNIDKEQQDILFKLATLKSYVELGCSENNSKQYSEDEYYEDLFNAVTKLFE